jgi:hypothetical protein
MAQNNQSFQPRDGSREATRTAIPPYTVANDQVPTMDSNTDAIPTQDKHAVIRGAENRKACCKTCHGYASSFLRCV